MEKIALVFPGQGSQYIGMGKKLFNKYSVVRKTFGEASDILGRDYTELILNGSLLEISRIENALTAIFIVSVAYYRAYVKEIGLTPSMVAGHSLGEYAALTCAGVISFKDALEIIQYRSELAKELVDAEIGSMSIVDNISKIDIEKICSENSDENEQVSVSCYNSKNQFAISGHMNSLKKAEDGVFNLGGQATPLFGSAPFHSGLMEDVGRRLGEKLKCIKYNQPRYPIISNVTGKPYGDKNEVCELLIKQLSKPVQWEKIINCFDTYGITTVVELGPKNVLSKLIESYGNDMEIYSYDQIEDREKLINKLQLDDRLTRLKPSVVSKCIAAAVSIPNKNWNNEVYKKGVSDQVKKLKELYEIVDLSDGNETQEFMKEAINILIGIMKTKKISSDEQEQWIREIIEDTSMQYELNEFLS